QRREQTHREDLTQRQFPIYVFGRQSGVASYDAITALWERETSRSMAKVHQDLVRQQRALHPDFDDSNLDAVLFAHAKLRALGVRYVGPPLPPAAGLHPKPLLSDAPPDAPPL